MLNTNAKIYIAGHRGMVGSAIARHLKSNGCDNIITRTRSELDLRRQSAVNEFFATERPETVILAAAKVGGIMANDTYPADFLYDNLAIATNTIDAAYRNGTTRLLFLGSSCIYPKKAPQPISEKSLLTSVLEPTNEAYAIAKIAGLKLCEYYRKQYGVLFHSAMPTNLYGKGDNYHPENSHVLPALIRKFHEAKMANRESISIWGTGKPRRELLNVEDLASAVVHILGLDNPPNLLNIGTGIDHTVLEIANLVRETIGFRGAILTDPTKPDGTPRKLLDVTLLNSLGWKYSIPIEQGLKQTYELFLQDRRESKLRSF